MCVQSHSAGQWVSIIVQKPKFQDMSSEHEEEVPFLISYIGHQNPFQLPIVPSCYYHQPLQTQPLLGPNLQSNQYLSLILELYKSPSVLLFEDY